MLTTNAFFIHFTNFLLFLYLKKILNLMSYLSRCSGNVRAPKCVVFTGPCGQLAVTAINFRLEAYERNRNFGATSDIEPEYRMILPNCNEYVDANSDKKLPNITLDNIHIYLSSFDKILSDSAVNLYKEKYLLYFRLNTAGDLFYVKSACRAEMRKAVSYQVDVVFCNGHVNEAQCECAAGMGPNAHCKHVAAVLFACFEFSQNGSVLLEQTCTQKLQIFHQAKKYTGSPLKAKDINMPGSDEITNCASFDPRPDHLRNMPGYSSFFRNVCLSFPGIHTMPIFQIFSPANTQAVAHDHDYLLETPEDMFLDSLGVRNISDSLRDNIELNTRGQAANGLWFEERLKRISSSNFGRIFKVTERTNLPELAKTLTTESKSLKSAPILHGRKYEKDALIQYEKDFSCEVKDCGLFVSSSVPYLAASPDGIVNSSVICEVKCPYSARNKDINTVTVPYLKLSDGSLQLDTKHDYYYQIQGQLFCSDRQLCTLIVYTLQDIKYICILRDENFIASMLSKLKLFYADYFEEALLNKFFYKQVHA